MCTFSLSILLISDAQLMDAFAFEKQQLFNSDFDSFSFNFAALLPRALVEFRFHRHQRKKKRIIAYLYFVITFLCFTFMPECASHGKSESGGGFSFSKLK